MSTCANCIHHSLCDYNTNISGEGKVRLVYDEGADIKCSFFLSPQKYIKELLDRIEEVNKDFRSTHRTQLEIDILRRKYLGGYNGKNL